MRPRWQPVRLYIPPIFARPEFYQRMVRSIVHQMSRSGSVERALDLGWLEELDRVGPDNGRVFAVTLTENRGYNDVLITFQLKEDGVLLTHE